MQKYTDNANGNVPLALENMRYFYFISFTIKVGPYSFRKKNKAEQSFSL